MLKALLAAIRDEPIIQANAESANFEIVHLPPQSFDCLLLPIINRGELRDCSARIRILSAHGRSEYNKGVYLVPWESTGNRKDHTRMPRDESRNLAIAKQDRRSTSISLLGVAGPIAHMTWNDASKERPAFEVQLEVGGNALPPFWVFPTDRTGTIGTSYDAPEANFPETEEPNSDNVLKISYGDTPPFLHIFEYDEKEGFPYCPCIVLSNCLGLRFTITRIEQSLACGSGLNTWIRRSPEFPCLLLYAKKATIRRKAKRIERNLISTLLGRTFGM